MTKTLLMTGRVFPNLELGVTEGEIIIDMSSLKRDARDRSPLDNVVASLIKNGYTTAPQLREGVYVIKVRRPFDDGCPRNA